MENNYDVAIIGLSGRFPMAKNVTEFWQNLCQGKDCITRRESDDPSYIAAYGKLSDVDLFDASFFDFTPKEALDTDPQQRFLLEGIYEALENAGYCSYRYDGKIGLYVTCDEHLYVWNYIMQQQGDWYENYTRSKIYCDGTFSTKISYKLDLQGPSILSKYACASSLASIHLAYQGVLNGDCDMAVAGGVSIEPEQNGYYPLDNTVSKTGITRSFDSDADGFVPGCAMGLLILKRLEDAVEDHDNILAVIKGTAANNDGSRKAGFAAPSVQGQSEVIKDCLFFSGLEADDISYVETHGTATVLGDAIELRALKETFSENKNTLYIGSVKSNIGHTSSAAGVSNMIKTLLMLVNKKRVPSINYKNPNDELVDSILKVSTEYTDWNSDGTRNALVTALGLGGANVAVILGEAEENKRLENKKKDAYVFVYSGKSADAVKKLEEEQSTILSDQNPEDVAYTLQTGRGEFRFRQSYVAGSLEELKNQLVLDKKPAEIEDGKKKIAFAISGNGSLSGRLTRDLYNNSIIYRDSLSSYLEEIYKVSGINYMDLFEADKEVDVNELSSSENASILIFALEMALSETLISLGVEPDILVGHSLGEYVAACLAGIINPYDAIRMLCKRSELMKKLPEGGMITINSSREKVESILSSGVSVGIVNAPNRIIVTGAKNDIQNFIPVLEANDLNYSVLPLKLAGHSSLMLQIADEYKEFISGFSFKKPCRTIYSSCLAKKVSNEMSSPDYWIKQMVEAVSFYDTVQEIGTKQDTIWIEVGLSDQLTTAIAKAVRGSNNIKTVPCFLKGRTENDYARFLDSLGTAWKYGAKVNWDALYEVKPYRVPLNTYPFEREHFWRYKKTEMSGAGMNYVKNASMEERKVEKKVVNKELNETEKVLLEIFGEALGVEDLSLTDELFQLGLDSFSIIFILQQVELRLKQEVTIEEMYTCQDVADLVNLLKDKEKLAETGVSKETVEIKKSLNDLFD